MKYLATIKFGSESWSELCKTEDEAKNWLDERNNNLEHTTIIDLIGDDGMFIDGYIYSKGAE